MNLEKGTGETVGTFTPGLKGLPEEFDGLTLRQKSFIVLYCHLKNATRAARLAGYEGDDNTMAAHAARTLRNGKVQAAMDAYLAPVFEHEGISVGRILHHLAEMAFAPWGKYVTIREDKDGKIVQVQMNVETKRGALNDLAGYIGLKRTEKADEEGSSQHLHLHYHKDMSAEEARRNLLEYLKNQ